MIAIFLLVLPLFLQNLLLYKQEFEEKLKDTQEELQALAKEKSYYLAEGAQLRWALLDAKQDTTPKNETFFRDPDINVKRLYIEKVEVPRDLPDRFVIVSEPQNALLVGIKVSINQGLVIPIRLSELILKSSSLPIQVAVIGEKDQVLWGNSGKGLCLRAQETIFGTDLRLQLSVERGEIHDLHLAGYFYRIASLVFFIGVLGGGAVYFFVKRMGRPLQNLMQTMQRVSLGSAHARYTPDAMGFEINDLGIQFNETLDALSLYEREVEKERRIREKLAQELRIGHEIQANLLPKRVPGLKGLDIATGYFAAKEVNGDFYDLFHLENGQLLIAICDTAGKGISACLYALGLRSILRAFASVLADVGTIVRRANDLYLIDAHETSMFSTLWLSLYDPITQTLTYCSQGHPPALLRRNGALKELSTQGISLGAQKVDVIHTEKITLQKGDALILYTDGLTEAHNLDHHLFGKERLDTFILQKTNQTSQQIIDQLVEEVELFSHGVPQHDDITLMVLQLQD
jgi:serine phosphatase RsbU (regulator of sigma subunit)